MQRGINRRAVVMAGAALSAAPLLRRHAFASGQPLIRYNAASPEGAAMLRKFAEAVKLMSARSTGDPLSWTFQWYTHYVRGDRKKDDEVAKLPPAQSALAADVWNTCQSHGDNHLEDCFLPWHRMFVFHFERIVRAVLNDDSFTLPYWDYTNPDHRALPVALREPASAANPLYRKHRKASVNLGHPLDEGQGTPSPLDPTCLDQQNYLSGGGAKQGFCLNLDSGVHASVHVLVGDRYGMGDVQWAANDPIFWLHHSNVDRLWASWNAGGNRNPDDDDWRNRRFAFADENGARVEARVGDFDDIATLGYGFDRLEPVAVAMAELPKTGAAPPSGGRARAAPPSTAAPVGAAPQQAIEKAAPPSGMVASSLGPVAIGAIPIEVALNVPVLAQAAPGATVGAAPPTEKAKPPALRGGAGPKAAAPPPPAAAEQPSHLYLVIRNLQARAQPGVLYAVYLNLGKGAAKKSVRLGTINFFDAGMAGMVSQKFASFDVTGILDGNVSAKDIGVTIAPVGVPATDAKPVIGEITLASA